MGTIAAPTIGYALLLPFIVVFAAACVGVLVEAVVPRDLRRAVQLLLAFLAVAVALVVTVSNWAVGADVVVGVPQEVADRLDASGEKWRVNGKYVGCAISRVVVRSAHRSFCLTDTPSYRFCLEAHR